MKRSPIKRKTPLRRKRPDDMKESEYIKIFPNGREVLNQLTKQGRDEYRNRTLTMLQRQGGKCGLIISPQCKEKGGRLSKEEAQFDHEITRGMGGARRDDRIEIDGKPFSRAVCAWCNCLRGSRPITDFMDVI